ncbi:hypothetical protein FQZ97_671300 [compost metagenome]
MDTRRREQSGIALDQHCRHRAAGGEAGHVDAPGVDAVAGDDLARHAGDQRGLAPLGLLVTRPEPVPALRCVGVGGLDRVQHDKAQPVGELVHARAGGKVVGILRASMQHHDQRHRLAVPAGRYVELVRAGARVVCEGPLAEVPGLRSSTGGRGLGSKRARRCAVRARGTGAAGMHRGGIGGFTGDTAGLGRSLAVRQQAFNHLCRHRRRRSGSHFHGRVLAQCPLDGLGGLHRACGLQQLHGLMHRGEERVIHFHACFQTTLANQGAAELPRTTVCARPAQP